MVYIGRYSPNQTRLLAILERLGGVAADSKKIVSLHYARRERPLHAQNSVVCVLNSLIVKVRRNREQFRVKKTERRGPYPIEYWMERHEGKRSK